MIEVNANDYTRLLKLSKKVIEEFVIKNTKSPYFQDPFDKKQLIASVFYDMFTLIIKKCEILSYTNRENFSDLELCTILYRHLCQNEADDENNPYYKLEQEAKSNENV